MQTERRRRIRNDRLIGVPQTPVTLTSLDELDAVQIGEIEHFFAAYNAVQGRTFKITGRIGAKGAERLLTQAIRRFRA